MKHQLTRRILAGTLFATLPLLGTATYAAGSDCDTGRALRETSAASAAMNPQRMQQQMLHMHDLMHRIQASTDPAERQRLEQEHAQLMQQHMGAMKSGMKANSLSVTAADADDSYNATGNATGAGPSGRD